MESIRIFYKIECDNRYCQAFLKKKQILSGKFFINLNMEQNNTRRLINFVNFSLREIVRAQL